MICAFQINSPNSLLSKMHFGKPCTTHFSLKIFNVLFVACEYLKKTHPNNLSQKSLKLLFGNMHSDTFNYGTFCNNMNITCKFYTKSVTYVSQKRFQNHVQLLFRERKRHIHGGRYTDEESDLQRTVYSRIFWKYHDLHLWSGSQRK